MDNNLIYNCTKDPPNNHPGSHTNSYAWDNLNKLLLHHDGDDVSELYEVYDVHPHEFYVLHHEGHVHLDHHALLAQQKQVKLDLK